MGHDTKVASWSELEDRQPAYALVGSVDLVVIRFDDDVSVLYGRCQHRDAIMADGHIDGQNLICGVHGWDYRYDTGVSEYNNAERLEKFSAVIDRDADAVLVDASEIAAFESVHPQYFKRDEYLGLYQDIMAVPKSQRMLISSRSPATACRKRGITERSQPWAFASTPSPAGTISKS